MTLLRLYSLAPIFEYDLKLFKIPEKTHLIKVSTELSSIPIDLPNSFKRISLNKIKKYTQNFFANYLKLHPILGIDGDEVDRRLEDVGLPVPTEIAKQALDGLYDFIDPFDLPITLVSNGDLFHGQLLYIDETAKAIEGMPFLASSIELNSLVGMQTMSLYAHEITHTQVMSVKGSVKNYYNNEVLSIFLELLASMEIDNSGFMLDATLKSLISMYQECIKNILDKKINQDAVIECMRYAVSIIKVFHLFDLYYSGDASFKKRIIHDIQEIFDGQKNVEAFLANHNVTMDNSADKKYVMHLLNQVG